MFRPTAHVSIKRRAELFFMFCVVTVLYLLIGAAGMRALERPLEDSNLASTAELVAELNLTESQRKRLEDLNVCQWPDPEFPNWTLSGAMFYSLTVITTIGYGSFAPRTYNGRSFTAFFAIIGISIVGQLLASCSDLISGILKGIRQRSTRRGSNAALSLEQMEEQQQLVWEAAFERWEKDPSEGGCDGAGLAGLIHDTLDDDADPALVAHVMSMVDPDGTGRLSRAAVARALLQFHTIESELPRGGSLRHVIVVTSVALAWILVWSAFFMLVESWSYRESVWFCFVTMSTIGFGDFTPHTKVGRGLCFAFIVPGLGLGAASLGAIWEVFEAQRFWLLQRLWAGGKVSPKLLEAHGIGCRFRRPSAIRRTRSRARVAAGCAIVRHGTERIGGQTAWVKRAARHDMRYDTTSTPTTPVQVQILDVPGKSGFDGGSSATVPELSPAMEQSLRSPTLTFARAGRGGSSPPHARTRSTSLLRSTFPPPQAQRSSGSIGDAAAERTMTTPGLRRSVVSASPSKKPVRTQTPPPMSPPVAPGRSPPVALSVSRSLRGRRCRRLSACRSGWRRRCAATSVRRRPACGSWRGRGGWASGGSRTARAAANRLPPPAS
eukprot:TRINITY_DN16796_c0_g1_i2.p1 TRINITY_DN16796_c0_g1~~TRINITY_DN16796_c0_g1_i2.p1  ORF type:complete len:608 (+),score=161.93 TRINITY_DN16796_c0_g1_i2:63-1886(+)